MTPEENVSDATPQWKVAVWGAQQSGKTAFLAALDMAKCPGWHVRVTGEKFKSEVQAAWRQNRVHKPTLPKEGEQIEPVSCTFTKLNNQDGAHVSVEIQIEDRPGEDWQKAADGKPVALEGLVAANAIVLLYDVTDDQHHLNVDRISNICTVIHGLRRERKAPLAVCFAKCDEKLNDPVRIEAARRDPKDAIATMIPKERFEIIERTYNGIFGADNVRFFPISSYGVRMIYGSVAPVIFYDESFDLRMVTGTPEEKLQWPINLTEPFLWIFDKLGIASKSV